MKIGGGFDLDADITVSELRHEDVLDHRLATHRQLRVRRRNDTLGVLVEASAWRELADYVRRLESQLDRYENHAVREIIGRRLPGAEFVEATPEIIDGIERAYHRLLSE